MSDQNTLEGNRLIAEFMGWTVKQNGSWWAMFKPKARYGTSYNATLGWVSEKAAWIAVGNKTRYHSSWDWLMPVIEKIESLGVSTDIHYYCGSKLQSLTCNHGTTFLGYNLEYDRTRDGKSKLEVCWDSVILFINWYNIQK